MWLYVPVTIPLNHPQTILQKYNASENKRMDTKGGKRRGGVVG